MTGLEFSRRGSKVKDIFLRLKTTRSGRRKQRKFPTKKLTEPSNNHFEFAKRRKPLKMTRFMRCRNSQLTRSYSRKDIVGQLHSVD